MTRRLNDSERVKVAGLLVMAIVVACLIPLLFDSAIVFFIFLIELGLGILIGDIWYYRGGANG